MQAVVAFVAGVFEDRVGRSAQGQLGRPGNVPGKRIGYGEIVFDDVLVDVAETFFDHGLVGHAAQVVVVIEVLGVDDQVIAVPIADGVAFPLELPGVMLAVEPDHPGRMHHLVQDHDGVLRLNDLHVVVVGAGDHGRSADEPGDAAVDGGAAFGPGAVEDHFLVCGAPLPAGFVQGRHAAVRGIVDQRGAAVVDGFAAALVPEFVIGNDARGITGAADAVDDQVTVLTAVFIGFPFRGLFFGEHFEVLEFGRPVQGRQGAERIGALEIGVAVFGARNLAGLGEGQTGKQAAGEGGERLAGEIAGHGNLQGSVVFRKWLAFVFSLFSICLQFVYKQQKLRWLRPIIKNLLRAGRVVYA